MEENSKTNEPIITVRNLNLWYGDHQALKDINLDIEEHKITALIGPSGCGKSTFMRCLGCERAPQAGRHGIPESKSVPDEHL